MIIADVPDHVTGAAAAQATIIRFADISKCELIKPWNLFRIEKVQRTCNMNI